MGRMRPLLRRMLRGCRDLVLGPREEPIIDTLIRMDQRSPTFFSAIDYVNYEQVPGDVVEFGVFTGVSLSLLAKGHSFDPKGMQRRFVGFDSFEGLPPLAETHARWREGACATTVSWHPLVEPGARVTPDITRNLFAACQLDPPELHVGRFDHTASTCFPSPYSAVALVHLDCDLYQSTKDALSYLLQHNHIAAGAVLLFDDWNCNNWGSKWDCFQLFQYR